ncbi:hypothetical protein [Flagellimonas zhangzhouensis]|uniref:DUF481 domain-containing protein n=1 Tax=Flagellimonas zhangzhouensis TaxID=1073328 RepID=A0A1H2YKW9_9FLAO|nr:hypothetical protein [Allomuricauda zhangzhouensis]SDR02091.1 hypothetical protein SAMN05216294_3170 [Allomuricauda zhangzhouensis]SDX05816.1 hypothetical protein SAMN04487892_3095 [Allomuricauda zhangzhouensis]
MKNYQPHGKRKLLLALKILFRFSSKGELCFFMLLTSLLVTFSSFAQEEKKPFLDDFSGTATVTNNGISLIPSFSLGDPALIFDLKFKKGRLSFEPDMRFALVGKPWTFIFWWRYKLLEKEKFSLKVGAHPAINFRTITIVRNGQSEEILESRRYLAAEVVPTYKISKNIDVGLYYLHGRGFDDGVKQTNFFVLTSSFNNLYFTDKYYFNITPQAYFLATDDLQGYYAAAFLSLKRKDFPLYFASTLNKALDTEISPEDDFTWNISLVYSFP